MTTPSSQSADLSKVLVVTGSIGSGKTTTCKILEHLGARCISADELAVEVVKAGSPALQRVAEEFGEALLDEAGGLNRTALAQIVFSDPEALKRLEAILHPEIGRLCEEQIAAAQAARAPLVVYDCPLYFESGLSRKGFGAVVVVHSPAETAIKRVSARDGLSEYEVELRQNAQISSEEKCRLADFVIENGGSLEELRQKVEKLAPELFALNKTSPIPAAGKV